MGGGITIPHRKRRHVVAVDGLSVIDPAGGLPERIHLSDYIASRLRDSFIFDPDFLAIRG